MGVGMVALELPLQVLLVTYQAMKRSGHSWPVISKDVQEACIQRLTSRARFNDGLPGDLANHVVQQCCDEHSEQHLLAFVYGYPGDRDLLRMRTNAEKYLLLTTPTSRNSSPWTQ